MTTAPAATAPIANESIPVRKKRREIPFVNSRVRPIDIARLCDQWAQLHAAGIPVDTSLRSLADAMAPVSARLAEALDRAADRVTHEGCSPADAFVPEAKIFGPDFIANLEIGYRTGKLDEQLLQLRKYFDDEHKNHRSLLALLWKPVLFSVAALVAGIVVVFWTVPALEQLYGSFGRKIVLPWSTRALIAVSAFGRSTTGIVILALVLLSIAGASIAYASSERLRHRVHTWMLSVPGVKSLVITSSLARAFRTMALVIQAGMTTPEAIRLGASAATNLRIRELLHLAADECVDHGRLLGEVLKNTKIIPPHALAILKAADQTGTHDTMLARLAESMFSDSEYYRQRFQDLIDPVSTAVFGGLAALIALALYAPLFSIFEVLAKK
ncbi:MAG: type II secretion system F family protein [Blastocatellia bacterium]